MAAALLVLATLVAGTWGALAAATAEQHLMLGLNMFKDGFHEMAARELRAFLEKTNDDPRTMEVLYILARAEMSRGEPSAAVEPLEKLAGSTNPRTHEAVYLLGRIYEDSGESGKAISWYKRYAERKGLEFTGDVLLRLANLQEGNGRAVEASEYFKRFVREFGRDERLGKAVLGSVRTLTSAGRFEDAYSLLADFLASAAPLSDKQAELALVTFVKGAREGNAYNLEARGWDLYMTRKIDPGKSALHDRSLYEAGLAWLRDGKKERAVKSLSGYLAGFPKGKYAPPAVLTLVGLHRELGDDGAELVRIVEATALKRDPRVEKRMAELARRGFSLAVKLKKADETRALGITALRYGKGLVPEEAGFIRITLGNLALSAGEVEKALAHWEMVPEATSFGRAARLAIARELLAQGKPLETLNVADPYLDKTDSEGEFHLIALKASAAGGKHRQGIAVCDRLLAMEDPPMAHHKLLELKGDFQLKAKDAMGRKMTLERLAANFPETDEGGRSALTLLLTLDEHLGGEVSWEKTLTLAETASRADKRTAAFYRARALVGLGRTGEAEAIFNDFIGSKGHDHYRVEALIRLGVLAELKGDFAGAAELYKRGLAEGRPPALVQWARQRLKAIEKGRSSEESSQPAGQKKTHQRAKPGE